MLGLTLIELQPDAGAQTISDRIRDASRKPGTPVVVGVLGEPIPLSVEELTRRSDLVVEAVVSKLGSRIDATDTAVITDFSVVPARVLAGTIPLDGRTPGMSVPLVLSMYGGEFVRDGVTVRAENHGLEPLKTGAAYLLFLKRFGEKSGVYQVFNDGAFEISDDTARPLATHGAELYKDFVHGYREVASRIIAAAQAR